MIHAGKTAIVICDNTCFRVVIDGETAAVVPRTTTSEIHRYKASATDKRGRLIGVKPGSGRPDLVNLGRSPRRTSCCPPVGAAARPCGEERSSPGCHRGWRVGRS
jgi:hypothetical protein